MAQGSIGGFLPLSGGTLTGALITTAGTSALPGLAVGEVSTGFSLRATGALSLNTNAVSRIELSGTGIKTRSDAILGWTPSTPNGTLDTAFSRVSGGIVALGTGAAGNTSGTLQANIQLSNAYVAGAVVGTGSVTIKDSTGTTYRVPVLV